MKEDSWHLIKNYLDTHSHENVVKGVISHISQITDNEKLDIIYLNYLDNDAITSVLSDELIQLIEKMEESERESK